MKTPESRVLPLFSALPLVAILAACSSNPSPTSPPEPVTGPYRDGEYAATGEYVSPAGVETIQVTVTLKSDLIDDVVVEWTDGDASAEVERFQNEFIVDILPVVQGVHLDEIVVDRVGGSSLTSSGFKVAIEQIKALAQL